MKQQFTTEVHREWGMWSASILGVIVVIKPMINITAVQVNGSLAIKPAEAADIVSRFTLHDYKLSAGSLNQNVHPWHGLKSRW